MNDWSKTKRLAVLGMFAAIVLLLAFTPFGFIQLPFIKATILHVPVIIGAIMLGPKHGAVLGFLFGATSLINNTMTPALSSFAFSPFIPVPGTARGSAWALAVCFAPRMLVGVVPWLVYSGLRKIARGSRTANAASLAAAGVAGSLTNTLLVMHLIFFLFRDAYAHIRGVAIDAVYGVVIGVITANGIPEAIFAAVLTAAVCQVTQTVVSKRKRP
ncbi:MAG: ECF transporter S component [Oscillospiraceae bacterium]|nr:ECF transporter S component [Oscillospiraceae bacterium]